MKNKFKSQSPFVIPRALIALLLCGAAVFPMLSGTLLAFFHSETGSKVSQQTLTFAERVAYQRAIEEVYLRHGVWPKENLNPKPSLDAVMSQAELEKKVEDYLRKSRALEDYSRRPIAEQLQAEMDRMAQHTKQPDVLSELFEALGNDPLVIAECLARPVLAERLLTNWYSSEVRIRGVANEPLDTWLARVEKQVSNTMPTTIADYRLPAISDVEGGCVDTWTPTNVNNAPSPRSDHTAVWTGSEMIVWGSYSSENTGGRYNPATNSWLGTSIVNAPAGRYGHTAIWSGSEMIVWSGSAGGYDELSSGGRYNPVSDSWTVTSTINAPNARHFHTGVWTGSEMIVWSGTNIYNDFNTGGRYCAESAPTPTPKPTAVPRVTPRPRPTPAPRPTP